MPGIAPYSVGSHALPRASSGVPAERGPALAARETGAGMGVLLRPSASSPSSLSERTAPGDGVASRDVARNGAGRREAERCPASPLPGAGQTARGPSAPAGRRVVPPSRAPPSRVPPSGGWGAGRPRASPTSAPPTSAGDPPEATRPRRAPVVNPRKTASLSCYVHTPRSVVPVAGPGGEGRRCVVCRGRCLPQEMWRSFPARSARDWPRRERVSPSGRGADEPKPGRSVESIDDVARPLGLHAPRPPVRA